MAFYSGLDRHSTFEALDLASIYKLQIRMRFWLKIEYKNEKLGA
jgi:hypothetical protein